MNQSALMKPIVLVILDGFGIAPASSTNPISNAKMPNYTMLVSEGSYTELWAHGEYVGLPANQDGNSEAGHLNLGAGRVVRQDAVVISEAIKEGTFFKNPALREAIQHVKRNRSRMHLMGMLSDGQSAHATPGHLYALLKLMDQEGVAPVYLHLFTDGRDSAPNAGKILAEELIKHLRPNQAIATIIGRFYAMDRKKEWLRTQAAYNAIVLGEGACVRNPLDVFDEAYRSGISDEYIKPHVVCTEHGPVSSVQNNDTIIFFNHRSDRARQLTKPFVQLNFVRANPGAFEPIRTVENLRFVAMTDFGPDLGDILTAFPSIDVHDTLPKVFSSFHQLYIAESEKYAHITYFFNGGYADPVGGEERLMVLSPDVKRYDLAPSMSTEKIIQAITEALDDGTYDFIAANIACADMVAHTGNSAAAQAALAAVDEALGTLRRQAAVTGATLVVTADHGNIEEMKNRETGSIDTEHSKNKVPLVIWHPGKKFPSLAEGGKLADVAPTILALWKMQKPIAMTGNNLFLSPL